jgi:hypothetical protein
MREYNRIVIACPEQHFDKANNLAVVLGFRSKDKLTFTEPNFRQLRDDGFYNFYCVKSLLVLDAWLQEVQGQLQAPEHYPIVDLEAAMQAQAMVSFADPPDNDTIAVRKTEVETALDEFLSYGLEVI